MLLLFQFKLNYALMIVFKEILVFLFDILEILSGLFEKVGGLAIPRFLVHPDRNRIVSHGILRSSES